MHMSVFGRPILMVCLALSTHLTDVCVQSSLGQTAHNVLNGSLHNEAYEFFHISPDGKKTVLWQNLPPYKRVTSYAVFQNCLYTAFAWSERDENSSDAFPSYKTKAGRIYRSPDGKNVGGGGNTSVVYAGRGKATRMIPIDNRLYVQFENNKIYMSPDGNNLGGGGNTRRVYDGNQFATCIAGGRGGVYSAFTNGKVYFSSDGLNLGVGKVYDGGQVAQQIVEANGGIYTRFPKAIYFSTTGKNLGGGPGTARVTNGTSQPTQITVERGRGQNGSDAIVTQYRTGEIFRSLDGKNLDQAVGLTSLMRHP